MQVSPNHYETQTMSIYIIIYRIALFWIRTVSADIFGWTYLYLYLYLNWCICICIWIKVEQNICICICIWGGGGEFFCSWPAKFISSPCLGCFWVRRTFIRNMMTSWHGIALLSLYEGNAPMVDFPHTRPMMRSFCVSCAVSPNNLLNSCRVAGGLLRPQNVHVM